MDMTTDYVAVDRRTVLKGVGGLALAASVAGCTTGGGGDGGDAGDGGSGSTNDEVEQYLSETSNYDAIEDHTGESNPTVMVGVDANGGAFGFGPPAIRVDAGTTVTWEWTGEGSSHNVVHEDGGFESQQTAEAGFTFDHEFAETGTYLYYCLPHEGLGMKGAVVVV